MLRFVQSWVAGATRVRENGQMVDDLEGTDQQPKRTVAYSVLIDLKFSDMLLPLIACYNRVSTV